jgi:hypothetical protein
VNKERRIMNASGKTSSYDHRGKALKPSLRSLLRTIKGATKVTNHTLRDRIPRWWTHVNILTQLTIKKVILYIKLRDGPLRHDKKSVNSGHMSNWRKSLIIITTLLLLKITGNKTSLIALNRTVRASLNLIYPLTSDWTNMWRTRYMIPRANPLKSSNLLSHCVLTFWMKNNITIRSWLRKSSGCESKRRVIVRGPTKVVTTSNKLLKRRISRRRAQRKEKMTHPQQKKMTHQKRAHPRKMEHQTSVIYDGCRTVTGGFNV